MSSVRRKAKDLRSRLAKIRRVIPKEKPELTVVSTGGRQQQTLMETLRYDATAFCVRCRKMVVESQMFNNDVCSLCANEKDRKEKERMLRKFKREIKGLGKRRRKSK